LVQGQEYSANKLLSEVYSRFHAEVNLPELLETDRLLDELTGMETA
jgi:hypothetical protein